MDDLISRQAAIDAVETKIKKWNAVDGEGYNVGLGLRYTDVIDTLTEMPSAQPEIIRCKDCKNWDMTWTNDFSPNYHYCPMVDGVRKEDWFCADAEERRADE